ncbi:MAG: NTPase [Candidatus Thorarchaeota archaeon]
MKSNILLTGRPGIGKTTAIRRIMEKLETRVAMGFLSYESREKGKRVGFAIETLSGKKGTLAHVNFKTGYRVGKYQVSVEDIDAVIIPELETARESENLIIIDEIAKMELYSQLFAPEVRKCLDTGRVIGTIQDRRGPFLDEVRQRNDVRILELTQHNRDDIPFQVLAFLDE